MKYIGRYATLLCVCLFAMMTGGRAYVLADGDVVDFVVGLGALIVSVVWYWLEVTPPKGGPK